MTTEEKLEDIQKSLKLLLEQNATMSQKIVSLEKENEEIKRSAETVSSRVAANKQQWVEMCKEGVELFEKLMEKKKELLDDGVDKEFCNAEELSGLCDQLFISENLKSITPKIKTEVEERNQEPFKNIGKEEKMDVHFGQDRDYSAVSMRRFVERYKVVRQLNMEARLTGWDSSVHRAGKLKLCLAGDAFDYVSLASSMAQEWTFDDNTMLEKLKDKFINIYSNL